MKNILKSTLAAAAVFAVAGTAIADETVIYAGAVLDVANGDMKKDQTIVVRDNRIVSIFKTDGRSAPKDAKVIDLSGKTVLPGLMDMHVHLSGDAETPFHLSMTYSIPRQTVVAVKNAKKTLMAGFTTVRNVGAAGYSVIGVRDGINAGEIEGPRIWAAGHSLGITGGHCDNNFLPPEMKVTSGGVADGTDAVRQKVRENIKYGANAIKLCATGGVFSKGTKVGIQQYSVDEMKAAVEEAHRRGVTVAAHAHGTDGIKAAIVAGVDSVEHVSFLDDEGVELAKRFGTYFSMDIYNTEYTLTFGEQNGVPEENLNKERQVSKRQRESFTKAVKGGVNMVFGSDAAIYPHGDNPKQLSRMVKFGMTPLQVLQAATVNSAALLKQENDLGQIKEGFLADIIAVDGDPLKDITVLENVSFVMKDGDVYKK
ncbi:amidohydrolase family protein [Kordiimonas sp. SCSIO 12603]|uniref:Xaa-Pro dipeptidase n=1 Tax=Kordiimonas sp. SCSIO 12603 TaxID=2829596 RepID=UPI002105C980|nr:amidohydrolase family protein [Kordiimonas sp. SCSIO 12603]UTW59365.1 amidohydrolase family protein [Kordiimonas sp. SCSIO 12603]